MKIRTRLWLLVLLPALFGLIMYTIYDWNNRLIEQAETERKTAEALVRHALELELLLGDYIRHPNQERSRDQWMQKHKTITVFLAKAEVAPENREALNHIHQLFINLRQLYTDKLWKVRSAEVTGKPEYRAEDRVFDVMLLTTHQLVAESLALAHETGERLRELRITANRMVLLAAAGMSLSLVLIAFLIGRQILRSMQILKTGSETIGTGNLAYRLSGLGNDEIGDVGRAFNAMTEKLQSITASKEVLNREIDERKKIEIELENYQRFLEDRVKEEVEKSRAKETQILQQSRVAQMGEMLTNISHHWRQPLNLIGLNIQELRDAQHYGELTPEHLEEVVEQTMNVLTKMSLTLNQFREFTAARSQKETFVIAESVYKLLELVRPALESHFIQIDADLDKNLTAYGDKNLLNQALYNLLHNAQEAMVDTNARRRTLTLTLKPEGNRAQLSIADTGGGIEAAAMARLFEPFFTTKERANKTGTGLYFAKTLIENELGGTITAVNAAEGACFTITLPLPGAQANKGTTHE